MGFDKCKRIWLISDTHFGVRNNSVEWIDIIEDYFYNFFIPLVEKNYRPGDVLVHCGDVFESRNAINLRVMNSALRVFERLSGIFKDGIAITVGNHDLYHTTTEINSTILLKWVPNIRIFLEPESVKFGNTNFLMVPWINDHKDLMETVKRMSSGNEYMVCHTDFCGMKYNKSVNIEEGCDAATVASFKRVYSGHIHYAQKIWNVTMLGCPYQLTRNDINNEKGITLLDLETGTEQYWENDHSPRFLRMKFTDVLEMTPERLNGIFRNNFVDLYIDGNTMINVPLNSFYDLLDGKYRRIDPHPLAEESVILDEEMEQSNFDLLKFVDLYVSTLPYDDDVKKKINEFVSKLYNKVEQQSLQSA